MAQGSTSPRTPEASPYSRHLPALDGVRGLAILLVMGSHFFPGTPHNLPERFVRSILSFGATGVDLFFVLSGFLITGILYDSLADSHFFRKFYARRALRILPLYYGVVAVYAIIGLVRHLSSHGELLSLALYMQNTSLIAPPIIIYRGPLGLPLGHFWSLAIEEQFYLVWPLLVFLLRTRRRLLILCATFMLLCPAMRFVAWQHGATFFTVHTNTFLRADSLLIGGALALLLRSHLHDRVLSFAPWLSLAILLLPALSATGLLPSTFSHPSQLFAVAAISYSLLAAGYCGVLAASLSRPSARFIFSTQPLRFLGKYSYGLYVLHLILLSYLEPPLRSSLRTAHVPNGLAVLLVGVIGFIVSVAAAYLSYQLFERHFLRLKRFFDYRPHGAPSQTVALDPPPPSQDHTPATSALN